MGGDVYVPKIDVKKFNIHSDEKWCLIYSAKKKYYLCTVKDLIGIRQITSVLFLFLM